MQVLFMHERSLTYHCAWHLRLAESWMPFRLPAVGSRAARGYLLSPLSFACLHTLFVWSLVLLPQRCGWDAVVLESVCLLSFARQWCRNPTGTTHVVRHCFQGIQANVCMLFPRACSVAVFCRRGCTGQSPLGCFALQRLATPAAVAAHADPVPRGQRAPLDDFRALLIDQSAELVESFLPSRDRTWRRSREHQSSAHATESFRDSSRGSLR